MRFIMRSVIITTFAVVTATVAADGVKIRRPLGLIEVDTPIDKPITVEIIQLGEVLFFDKRLSRSGRTSCATCHDPVFAFADPRAVSVSDSGVAQRRNAPTLYNVGYLPSLMWDGRFRTLEEQSQDPFQSSGEMGKDISSILEFIRNDTGYQKLFEAALISLNADGIGYALATFQRSLVSGDTAFDRYLYGDQKDAFSEAESRGLEVFSTKAGCLNCHDVFHPNFNALGGGVALFTDFRFHNLGVGYEFGRMADAGRYLWSRDSSEWGAFRTPTLRNITLTAPYMHDGSLKTLDDVVDFYNKGGNQNPNLSPSIKRLFLSKQEKSDLVAFLKTLTDPNAEKISKQSIEQQR